MKVQVYSNFRFFLEKIKSSSSMRNRRFHRSKCKGKVQKMGVLYTYFLKRLGPFFKLSQKNQKKKKKKKEKEKRGHNLTEPGPAGDQ
jgi:hypothetical protein